MRFKINSARIKIVLSCVIMLSVVPAFALTEDQNKPLNIDSENQSLDMQSNVATFTGNVIITQGTIKITADKVIVTQPGGDSDKTLVTAWGEPATFYQMQDNGKPVRGRAKKMYYDLQKSFVELTNDAYIEQLDSNVKGDRITYLVKEQKMQAWGNQKANRVTTVLVPSQLQDKASSSESTQKSN